MQQPMSSFGLGAPPSKPRVIRLRELRLEQVRHVLTPLSAWFDVRSTVESLLSTGDPCRDMQCVGAETLVEEAVRPMGKLCVYYPPMNDHDPRMEACRRLLDYGDFVVVGRAFDRIVDLEDDANHPGQQRWAITRFGRSARNAPALLRHTEELERRGRLQPTVKSASSRDVKSNIKTSGNKNGELPSKTYPNKGPLPVPDTNESIKKIGDIISAGEGSYESYNSGTKGVPGGRVGHSFLNPPIGTVTNKTINEIIATESLPGSDPHRLFATGKYQTTISTLREGKRALGLTGDEKYDAEMQERFFRDYLLEKAGNGDLASFVKHGEGTVDDAQYAAAKEWASIAVPAGRTINPKNGGLISDGTLSYYQSEANGANLEASNTLRKALSDMTMENK